MMADAHYKHFSNADEVRTFPKGKAELVHINGGVVGRFTLEPGWRWSEHVKPIAGTEWCEAPHSQYVISGTMHVVMADGAEFDVGPETVLMLPPGHDAWVVGDQPVVAIDWTGAVNYAKS